MEDLVSNQGLSHLALHIFSYLNFDIWNGTVHSMKDINNCRLVCKSWQAVIDTSLLYWQKRLNFQTMEKWMTLEQWEEFDLAFDSVLNHKVWMEVRDFALHFEEYLKEVEDYNEHDPLHYYCQQGNTEAVELLIKFYMNLDTKDKHKTTPLMAACSLGHTNIVNLFLNVDLDEVRIDYNMRDDKNYTALLYACRKGRKEVVKLLFEKSEDRQIDLHAVSNENMNVFGWSIWSRNENLLDFVINNLDKYSIASDHLINGFNNQGGSYFTIACWRKNLKAVKYFLQSSKELSIDINQKDHSGRSGLYLACLNGCIEIVKLLAENAASKGINVEEVTSDWNNNVLVVAAMYNRETVVKYILCHSETFKCNIHAVDMNGRVPFLIACWKDSIDVVKVMLESLDTLEDKKSMLTYQDYLGNNALMLTIIYGYRRNCSYKTLKYLLEQMVLLGIPLSDRNKDEDVGAMTVFDMICTFGVEDEIAAYLQVVENHVDYADQNGETGFIKACKHNRYEIVDFILKTKGRRPQGKPDKKYWENLDLNATDDEWMTGFMWACKLQCARVVEVILQHVNRYVKIDLIANDKQGRTGYDLWPKKIPFPLTKEYLKKRHIYHNLGPKLFETFLGAEP